MKNILFVAFILFGATIFAQNPVGFDEMAKNMTGKKTPIITMKDVQKIQEANKNIVFLDSREENEYQTSHLPGAIWVGCDNIDWAKINKLDKNTAVVVYCSVGYRSGKLTDQLSKKGFNNIQNLYGGLFNWANNGGTLENNSNQNTQKAHGYNKTWSKWLNPDRVTIVL